MSFAHIFADIFVVFGVIFVLSLLGYLIPQLVIRILKPLDLKKRYGGGFAFITGGNSGMGEQFAKKVAKMGFNIIILAEDEDRLNKVAKEINDVNPQCRVIIINADLSGDPEKVTEQVIAKLQNVDISIMFFNAGYGVVELAANPSENTLRQFRTNIVTHQYLFQALYPKLASRIIDHKQQGAIRRGGVLFTASLAGFIYPPGSHVYGATKEYLGHLGECLATEAEYYGIDVVSLYPGFVNTRFLGRLTTVQMPWWLEKINQNPDAPVKLALTGLGRITRVDSGFQSVLFRLFTKIVDANIFIKMTAYVTPPILRAIKLKDMLQYDKKNE